MPILSDFFVILDSPGELRAENDIVFDYRTGGRHQSTSTIDIDWGRAPTDAPFLVELSLNDTLIATRSPKALGDGSETYLDRIIVQRLLNSGDNTLRIRSLTSNRFLLRSVVGFFRQDD